MPASCPARPGVRCTRTGAHAAAGPGVPAPGRRARSAAAGGLGVARAGGEGRASRRPSGPRPPRGGRPAGAESLERAAWAGRPAAHADEALAASAIRLDDAELARLERG